MTKQIKQLLDEAQEELDNENYTDLKISLDTILEILEEII